MKSSNTADNDVKIMSAALVPLCVLYNHPNLRFKILTILYLQAQNEGKYLNTLYECLWLQLKDNHLIQMALSFSTTHLFQAIMHHLRLPALLLVLLALLRCVTMAPSPR